MTGLEIQMQYTNINLDLEGSKEMKNPTDIEVEGKEYTLVPSQPFGFMEVAGLEELGKFTGANAAEVAIKHHLAQTSLEKNTKTTSVKKD